MADALACEAAITKGPRKGQPATGTTTGWHRHRQAGEPPCEPCVISTRRAAMAYYEQHREQVIANVERWQKANRAKHRQYISNWARNNRPRRAEYRRKQRATMAQALHIPFTTEQLAQRLAYWGDRCWMCGGDANTVDHVIPLARGGPHCLANLRPACGPCNSSKGTRDIAATKGATHGNR